MNILDKESELLAKVAAGDERAFRVIFNAFQKKIYASALRMLQDEVLAEEVVQLSMLRFWMMGKGLLSVRSAEGYLMKISRNCAFDLLRRKELQFRLEKDLQLSWSETHNETQEQILLNETRKILQQGIAMLPAQQKLVYQLCHEEGLKYKEVASRLNLSVETVRSYMRLAQVFLREHMRAHHDIAVLLIIFKLF